MYQRLRPLLFRLDPETAHHLTLALLRWGGGFAPTREMLRGLYAVDDSRLQVNAFGVDFKNPVGLAAGYDKNGTAVSGLAALGFGHIEVGTLTRLPQSGNEKPRVWRAPEAKALVNRMGFPNNGIERLNLYTNVRQHTNTRVGVNIGKSKDTPIEQAAEDYVALLRAVHSGAGKGNGTTQAADCITADYCAVNVSSPNTPGLRALQARELVQPLLRQIADARDGLSPRIPVLVKIAPDLSFDEIDAIVDAARDAGLDGIIATNTTLHRTGAPAYTEQWAGGMSGRPLRERSTEIIRHLSEHTRGEFPIIGVGGIHDPESALEKLRAGATLIQVFTGLVYEGPGLVRRINEALLRREAPATHLKNGSLTPRVGDIHVNSQ